MATMLERLSSRIAQVETADVKHRKAKWPNIEVQSTAPKLMNTRYPNKAVQTTAIKCTKTRFNLLAKSKTAMNLRMMMRKEAMAIKRRKTQPTRVLAEVMSMEPRQL